MAGELRRWRIGGRAGRSAPFYERGPAPLGCLGRARRRRESRRLAQYQRRPAGLDLELGQLRLVEQLLQLVDQLDELRRVRVRRTCERSRSLVPPAEYERGVLAAEAEGVDQRRADLA